MHPTDIVLGGTNELEVPDLQRNDFKRGKGPRRGDISEVHQHQVPAKFLVTADPFVVIEEITAAIENEPIAVNVDGPRMMRRMAVDDRNVGPVNERMGKTPLCVRDFVTPICSPMHRYNDPRRTWARCHRLRVKRFSQKFR